MIQLTVAEADPLHVAVDRRIVIGRDCDGLVIADERVSRRHLAVSPTVDGVVVEDLGSSNGTDIDGVRVTRPTILLAGQTVQFGSTTIRLSAWVAGPPVLQPAVAGARGRPTIVGDDGASRVVRPVFDPMAAGTGDFRPTAIATVADQVAADRSTWQELQRQTHGATLTFLFSDIQGSTKLAEALGDQIWFQTIQAHNSLVEGLVQAHRGTVVKAIGDGYLCTFPAARHAMHCAIAIQQGLVAHESSPLLDPVRVRIGLHTGEAIMADGDLLGLHVTIASRVADRATGGQILVSDLTRSITRTAGDFDFGDRVELELKGLEGTYSVSELRWRANGSS